jgi:hypothetical protein
VGVESLLYAFTTNDQSPVDKLFTVSEVPVVVWVNVAVPPVVWVPITV